MNAHLAKLSLALLSAVFLLGCQEQGSSPVGLEGLGPELDKRGSGSCAAAASGGHCHGDEEATEFTVKVTGDIFSVGGFVDGVDGLYEATRNGVRARGFQLDISSIFNAVTCAEGGELPFLPNPLTGTLGFGNFLNDYIILFFEYNGADHYFQSQIDDLDNPDPWPPTVAEGTRTVTQGTGEWSIQNQDKNHRDGCTGESGPGSITWEAEVTNITGTR